MATFPTAKFESLYVQFGHTLYYEIRILRLTLVS
jgi:hypothetical protein